MSYYDDGTDSLQTSSADIQRRLNELRTQHAGLLSSMTANPGRDIVQARIGNLSQMLTGARQREQDAAFQSTMQGMAKSADPFASQRGQYQQRLSDLLAGKGVDDPFYKAAAAQGQEAASRRLAKAGMLNSGNAAIELQNQAMGQFSDHSLKLADMLAGLSGAKADPSNASNAMVNMLKLKEDARQFDQGTNRRWNFAAPAMSGKGGLGAYWGG